MSLEKITHAASSFRDMAQSLFAIVDELANSQQEALQALRQKLETANQATRFTEDEIGLIDAALTLTGGLVETCIAGKQIIHNLTPKAE